MLCLWYEKRFSEKHPDKWIPLYSMVTYSPHIRYSAAFQNGQKQEAIMQKIMAAADIDKKWDSDEVAARVKALGAEYIPKPFSLKVIQDRVAFYLSL